MLAGAGSKRWSAARAPSHVSSFGAVRMRQVRREGARVRVLDAACIKPGYGEACRF